MTSHRHGECSADDTDKRPGVVVGSAAVLRLGDYVYAFGSGDTVKSHPIYAVRWPTQDVHDGKLLNPEWWGVRNSAGYLIHHARHDSRCLITASRS